MKRRLIIMTFIILLEPSLLLGGDGVEIKDVPLVVPRQY